MTVDRRTPLLDVHRSLGAKIVDFAGWDMPLSYGGVIAEHRAVRTDCGVFDVSHLGKLRVSGPRAGEALQFAVTADVLALEVGKARYALVLTDDGGTVDDVFVYRIAPDEWLVVPNAANVSAVAEQIVGPEVVLTDEWDRWAILAVQGPSSFDVFSNVVADAPLRDMKLHEWVSADFGDEQGIVARTGYTGERGVEAYVPAGDAVRVFRRVLATGAAPAGLGARDTLRLEMGYALYGHELNLDINPLEAGLGWAIAWDAAFRGKDALEKVRAERPARRLFGILCRDRGVPRQGYAVTHDGVEIGTVTSGNHSPTLGTGIALALGPHDSVPEAGTRVAIEARGRSLAGDIVEPPFVTKKRSI